MEPSDNSVMRWKLGPAGIPVAVACSKHGYPNCDGDGNIQYVNSHWDTEEEAWAAGENEVDAACSLAASTVSTAESMLTRAVEEASGANTEAVAFRKAKKKYLECVAETEDNS